MPGDIRSYFSAVSKGKNQPVPQQSSNKRKNALNSDDEVVPPTPTPKNNKIDKKKKRKIIHSDSDDSEDAFVTNKASSKIKNAKDTKDAKLKANSQTAAKTKPKELKEMKAIDIFGSGPVQRTPLPKPIKKVAIGLNDMNTELGIHSDDSFDQTLIQLDEERLLSIEKSSKKERSEESSSEKASNIKDKAEIPKSARNLDESLFEKSINGVSPVKTRISPRKPKPTSTLDLIKSPFERKKSSLNNADDKSKKDFSAFINGDDNESAMQKSENSEVVSDSPLPSTPNADKNSRKRKMIDDERTPEVVDEERHEKKRYCAQLYKNYMNRSGPKHHGAKEVPEGTPDCFKGLAFLLTGVLDSFEKDEVKDIVVGFGGEMKSSISKKVTHLICGEDSGPVKLMKAKEFGIPVITEDEFLNLIKQKSDTSAASSNKTFSETPKMSKCNADNSKNNKSRDSSASKSPRNKSTVDNSKNNDNGNKSDKSRDRSSPRKKSTVEDSKNKDTHKSRDRSSPRKKSTVEESKSKDNHKSGDRSSPRKKSTVEDSKNKDNHKSGDRSSPRKKLTIEDSKSKDTHKSRDRSSPRKKSTVEESKSKDNDNKNSKSRNSSASKSPRKKSLSRTPKKEIEEKVKIEESVEIIECKTEEKTNTKHTFDSTTSWVDKYRPTTMKQIIGQHGEASCAKKLDTWLSNWYKNRRAKLPPPNPWSKGDGGYYKAILLSGPPGVGKTTTVSVVCKELGFDAVEFNASDTRSKNLIKDQITELTSTNSLSGFFNGKVGKGAISKKHVVIMDEVDGMAGNEDRGGMQELISLIKKTEVPIICICNDKSSPKIRSLINHCFDLSFPRPKVPQIKAAMMSVCFKEGVKISPESLNELIIGASQDVRQTLNLLSVWSSTQKNLSADSVTEDCKHAKKDMKMGPWAVCRSVFSEEEHKTMSIHDKSDLFFHDYSLAPLFVQQNYLRVVPHCPKKEMLSRFAEAADCLSAGDLVDAKIRKNMAWSLLPTQAMFSSVIPGTLLSGHVQGQIDFPGWLGQNSRSGKLHRLVQEIHSHTRLSTSGSKESIRLDYAYHIRDAVLNPLIEGADGVQEAIDTLQAYHLLREDLDSLLELTKWPGLRDKSALVDTKVKSAMTRKYNKEAAPLPYSQISIKKGQTAESKDSGLGELLDSENLEMEENEVENDDLESDAMIKKAKKAASTSKISKSENKTKSKNPSKGKGKTDKGKSKRK